MQWKVSGAATTHPAESTADADRVVDQLEELMPADCAKLLN
jgi:hypothetical protein